MEPLLDIQKLDFSYHNVLGETPAVSNLSFTVCQGEFVSVVGPSGCGKSTILSLITGLLNPEAGSILFQGKPYKENNLRIGYMLQRDHLLEWRSIYRNILLGLEIRGEVTKEKKVLAKSMLNRYGLSDFAKSKPSELSGGMRQRAALIRTLMLDPKLLLLDEPFSALDYQTRLTVGDEIGQIIKNEGKTALLVTHDLSEAISLADRIIVLSNRPATVKTSIPIHFPLTDDTPLRRRDTEEFKEYFNMIWKELNADECDIQKSERIP